MLRAMRWLIALLLLLIVAVAGVFGAGSALPVQHGVAESADIAAPVDEVWAVITDVKNLRQWQPNIQMVALLPRQDGLPSWRIVTTDYQETTLRQQKLQPHSLYVFSMEDPLHASVTTWLVELQATGEKQTRLQVTQKRETTNPFLRFLRYYLRDSSNHVRVYKSYLTNYFEKKAEAEES